jgi:2-polyprenyl-3-methyl-5-hydroxy-6-metoxy-1,4-benzoquinol methylase
VTTIYLHNNSPLAKRINEECVKLKTAIEALDISTLPIDEFYKWYFNQCHLNRQEFSLRTSARLVHDAIVSTGKTPEEIVLLDYGAGLGTTYLLAKQIGIKHVIYNDLLPEFARPAKAIDQALGIVMDDYLVGDVEATCKEIQNKKLDVDVVISRNVLEHIYDLKHFFTTTHYYLPRAVLYNSTTANYNNPMAFVQHIYLHKKAEPILIKKKQKYLLSHFPEMTPHNALQLAQRSPTLAADDLLAVGREYLNKHELPAKCTEGTNVCDETGNWREHLISYSKYRQHAFQYELSFLPGIWDVHQKSKVMRLLGKSMQAITNLLGKYGYITASFVYIVCRPKSTTAR